MGSEMAFRASLFSLIGTALILALSGCVETSAPLCSDANRIDVPALEREFRVAILSDPTRDLQEGVFTIKRIGKGHYQSQSAPAETPAEFSTCQVGPWVVSEAKTKFNTFRQAIVSVGVDGMVTQSQMVVDQRTLQAAGLSSEIVEREEDAGRNPWMQGLKRIGFKREEAAKTKLLLIKVDGPQAVEALGKIVKPMAMGSVSF